MRRLRLFLILYCINCVLLFAATQKVFGECEYRKDEVEEGRTCRKKCEKNSDCKGKNKVCLCDDVCGMSCFNPKSKCLSPKALPNGLADFSSSVYSSKISYSCKEGFELKGDSERVCRSDGKWSGKAPKCVELEKIEKIECSPPQNVTNGKIEYSGLVNGSTATYSCDKGFRLKGKDKRVCQDNGKWSEKAPRCEESVGCEYPPRISAGFANTAQSIFKVGDVVQYECRHGYRAQGGRTSECLDDGTWSSRDIICSKVNCGDPGQPLHGRATGDSFLFGSWVTYVCDEGYELSESSERKRYCSTSGRWSGKVPTCLIKTCFPPRLPKHGKVDYFDLDFGSVVKYSCEQGYLLNGTKEGRCMDDGTWGEAPSCEVDINCDFDAAGRQYCGYLNTGDVQWQTEYLQQSRSLYPGYALKFEAQSSSLFVASLKSPDIPSSRPLCLQFYYKIKKVLGSNNDVQVQMNGRRIAGIAPPKVKLPLSRWVGYQVTLTPREDIISFEILAKGGSDVLIDDVQINKGECVSVCKPNDCFNDGKCVDEITKTYCSCTYYYEGERCGTEILCDMPKKPSFGTITANDKIRKGDEVFYACDTGYELQGARSARCTKSGLSKPPPICEEVIQETAGDCPNNYVELGSMCYGLYNTAKNYADAENVCKRKGGRLAIVQSNAVDDFLRGRSPNGVQWIGIRFNSDWKRVWANGDEFKDVRFVHFSLEGAEPDTCGRFYYFNTWGWKNDKWYIEFGKCFERSRFICEKWKKSASSYKVNVPLNPEVSGIYKPVAGMLTKERRQVYRMKSGGRTVYMYYAKKKIDGITKHAWFIGDYKVHDAQPADWEVYADSHAIKPDSVNDWRKGEFNRVEVKIEKNDFWGRWTDWECDVTCGSGQKFRTRICNDVEEDALSCRGKDSETEPCYRGPCPDERDSSPVDSPCSPDPCNGNGNCQASDDSMGYVCFCKPEFTGQNCETSTSDASGPCQQNYCLNDGVCSPLDGMKFYCKCKRGFSGQRCEIKRAVPTNLPKNTEPETDTSVATPTADAGETSCTKSFCKHGGKCQVESGKRVCHCNLGNLGDFCEIKNACTTDSIANENIRIYRGQTRIQKTIAIGEEESLFISCANSGESVIGSNKITCNGGNNWSRSSKIFCEESNRICKLDSIPDDLEAFYKNDDEITSLPVNVQSGSQVKFVCKPPDQGLTIVECENGEWQSSLPNRCVTGNTCPDVKPLTNGEMKVSPPDAMPPYDPGVIITFSCDQYFTLTAAPLVKCQDDGKWSKKPSQCKDVGCFLVTFNLKTGVYVDKHNDTYEDITVDAGERLVLKCEKSDKQLSIKCEGKLKWDKPYEEFTCD